MNADVLPSPQPIRIPTRAGTVGGEVSIPHGATSIVLFAHGIGSGAGSPRNHVVAAALQRAGIATVLFDMVTPDEESAVEIDGVVAFEVEPFATRLVEATDWIRRRPDTSRLAVGYFGGSSGAAIALVASTRCEDVRAVVCRGGRVDLVEPFLGYVRAPTLLVVGEDDRRTLDANEVVLTKLGGPRRLVVIPGAGHLFSEPGTLERVAEVSVAWFERHLSNLNVRAWP